MRDHAILRVHGKIDCFNISELKSEIAKLITEQAPSIVLDLEDVQYMDSSGIGVIFLTSKLTSRYKGTFSLINLSDDLRELINLTAAASVIKICKDEQSLP